MNAAERHDARVSILAAHIVNPMPWVFHEYSLWTGTTKEWLVAADASEPGTVSDDDWPSTIHGSDFDPALGAFIAAASTGYPAALDAIDRVLALHQERDIGDGVKFCSYDHGDATPETWPCDIILAIEGAS